MVMYLRENGKMRLGFKKKKKLMIALLKNFVLRGIGNEHRMKCS